MPVLLLRTEIGKLKHTPCLSLEHMIGRTKHLFWTRQDLICPKFSESMDTEKTTNQDISFHSPRGLFHTNIDSAAKDFFSALRFILALLDFRCARRRSRFNRVDHCSVLLNTPHSSGLLHLETKAFYESFNIHGRVFRC